MGLILYGNYRITLVVTSTPQLERTWVEREYVAMNLSQQKAWQRQQAEETASLFTFSFSVIQPRTQLPGTLRVCLLSSVKPLKKCS